MDGDNSASGNGGRQPLPGVRFPAGLCLPRNCPWPAVVPGWMALAALLLILSACVSLLPQPQTPSAQPPPTASTTHAPVTAPSPTRARTLVPMVLTSRATSSPTRSVTLKATPTAAPAVRPVASPPFGPTRLVPVLVATATRAGPAFRTPPPAGASAAPAPTAAPASSEIAADDWRFQPGTLGWACPGKMIAGTPEPVTASLVMGAGPAAKTAIVTALAQPSAASTPGTESLEISQSMSVELLSEPANAFQIERLYPREPTPQDVGDYEQPFHAEWRWEVTPLRAGPANLVFVAVAWDIKKSDLTPARMPRQREAGRVRVDVSVAEGGAGDLLRSWWWVALVIPVFAIAAVVVRRERSARLAGQARGGARHDRVPDESQAALPAPGGRAAPKDGPGLASTGPSEPVEGVGEQAPGLPGDRAGLPAPPEGPGAATGGQPEPGARPADAASRPLRARLYEALVEFCTAEEIDAFVFEFGLDRDEIEGDDRSERARFVVEYFEHRNQLPALAEVVRRLRPDITI